MPASFASRPPGILQATASSKDNQLPQTPLFSPGSGTTAGTSWNPFLERPLNHPPVLDPQPLRDLLDLGAAPALVQELIVLFQEDVPTRLALLRTALAAGDGRQTGMEAHQLKGALSSLGLVRFAELASRIEACVLAGQLELAPAMAEALPAAYEEALQALKSAYPTA